MKKIIIALIFSLFIAPGITYGATVFQDVWESNEYYGATKYLYEHGIIQGYPDGTFKPTKRINRVEVLKILLEGLGEEIPDVSSTETAGFPDVIPDAWYVKYVKEGKARGIIKGYSDGYFRPAQTVRRSEALKMALETHSLYVNSIAFDPASIALPSDVKSSSWYAPYIRHAMFLSLINKNKDGKVYPDEFLNRGQFAEIIYRLLFGKENKISAITLCPCIVQIQNMNFSPSKLIIRKGSTVIFKNMDGLTYQVASGPHPAHTNFPALNGEILPIVGSTFEVRFPSTGMFTYHDHLHPASLGSIEVIDY